MMWEKEIPDPDKWKKQYLISRYGKLNAKIEDGWNSIFNYYYVSPGLFEPNPITFRPSFAHTDIKLKEAPVKGARLIIEAADEFSEIDSYRFDIVNISRQIFGQYAGAEFKDLTVRIERLLATREEFLFGKWLADSKERSENEGEAELYEWNARAIITTWGGRILYGYAIKDWAGLYSSYYLPKWEKFFNAMRKEMTDGEKLDYEKFLEGIIKWEDEWVTLREENVMSSPTGNSLELVKDLWQEYGEKILSVTGQKYEQNK
ncbi:MAG: alpha-N-acetylglucosaminidase C-terminal domain-containing protein [Bacteroidia bacterium]|nr:alpha-N-acetylglucosaminidase C-terminal domain-containing protein [Bacteroidia bacterium]